MRRRVRFAALAFAAVLAACAPRSILFPVFGLEPFELHDFPADFEAPLSPQTDAPMGGFGGGGGGVQRTPILFVHGNTESARFWLRARQGFIEEGWHEDELWAFSYGWNDVRWFDGNDLSAPAIGRMVDAMTAYLSKKSGREIRQVDIVAHSLGVTAVRQWMKQDNAWHRVRNLVAVAGANHGVWTARGDARGQNRVTALELAPDSAWLEQLNRGGETPGPTRYLSLYDGTGVGDVLFPEPLQDSPRLEGATNLAFNVEHRTFLDHLELPRSPQTVAVIADFLKAAGEPLPQVLPPRMLAQGSVLRAEPSSARLACAQDPSYPSRATPTVASLQLVPGVVYTCFATDPHSSLASPMARFETPGRAQAPSLDLALRADPAPGVFENAQQVRLEATEPGALILYTTTGSPPDSGSALYTAPIVVPGPLVLRAIAIAADGRRSPELRLRYDISLERLEAGHSLQRQLEPDAPVEFERTRRKGR